MGAPLLIYSLFVHQILEKYIFFRWTAKKLSFLLLECPAEFRITEFRRNFTDFIKLRNSVKLRGIPVNKTFRRIKVPPEGRGSFNGRYLLPFLYKHKCRQGQIEYTGLGLRIDAFCGWRHLVILPPYHRAAISDPPSYAIFIPRP